MKKVILFFVFLVTGFGLMAQSLYKVDPAHTSINFRVKHNGITFVNGKFEKFDGGIIGSLSDLNQIRIFFNVDVASINTSVAMRDDHLRGADFFDAEKFPAMTFESTGIEKVTDEKYKLHGKLQIKDVTKDVTFDVIYGGTAQGQDGAESMGFIARNSINRLDYDVSGDPEATSIGKEVEMMFFLEFKKAQ